MVLDKVRLNKQCLEAFQIVNVLTATADSSTGAGVIGTKKGWSNHPAVMQWRGHLDALKYYFNVHRSEAIRRGIKISLPRYQGIAETADEWNLSEKLGKQLPWFVNCPHFVYSHRASLMAKQEWYYRDLFDFPPVYARHGYFWPSHHLQSLADLNLTLWSQLMFDAQTLPTLPSATAPKSTTSTASDIDSGSSVVKRLETTPATVSTVQVVDNVPEGKIEVEMKVNVSVGCADGGKLVMPGEITLEKWLSVNCEPAKVAATRCGAEIGSGPNKGQQCTTRVGANKKHKSSIYCGSHAKMTPVKFWSISSTCSPTGRA